MRTELLKEILAVPTVTGNEKLLVKWLRDYLTEHGYTHEVDGTGNVLITKGVPAPGKFYPLVCAHTDSVHPIQPMEIVQTDDGHVYAISPKTKERIGCGGDDKCGVFICLELLEVMPVLKVALFWGEEIYCKGSKAVGPQFFQDVGYAIEFDSPQGNIVSFSCDGQQLFEEKGEFAKIAVPIMDKHGMTDWQMHPYTDVAILKRRFDFTCVNLPAGYYHMHSSKEIVNLMDVSSAIVVGKKMISALGQEKYPFTSKRYAICETERNVTGLVLDYDYGNEQKES